MDIDDFLDKELQVEKKEVVEEDTPILIPKEEKDIIKHYFGLWNKISETKFKWDFNLYSEFNRAEKKIKEELGRLLPEIERKKSVIKQLIGKAINEMDNQKYESATRLYSEITDIRNTFPDFFLEGKKEINIEIFRLYEKLHDQIDSKFINDFKESIAKVDGFINDSLSSLEKGNIEGAKDSYEKAFKSYKELPNGFLTQKIELGNGLLALYRDLSIHLQIKKLQEQLAKKSRTSYRYRKSTNLRLLSGIIKREKRPEKISPFPNLKTISAETRLEDKTLLRRLVSRKLERAKINLERGLYLEAKKNIDSILKVDPNNTEAKQLLNSVPSGY